MKLNQNAYVKDKNVLKKGDQIVKANLKIYPKKRKLGFLITQ